MSEFVNEFFGGANAVRRFMGRKLMAPNQVRA